MNRCYHVSNSNLGFSKKLLFTEIVESENISYTYEKSSLKFTQRVPVFEYWFTSLHSSVDFRRDLNVRYTFFCDLSNAIETLKTIETPHIRYTLLDHRFVNQLKTFGTRIRDDTIHTDVTTLETSFRKKLQTLAGTDNDKHFSTISKLTCRHGKCSLVVCKLQHRICRGVGCVDDLNTRCPHTVVLGNRTSDLTLTRSILGGFLFSSRLRHGVMIRLDHDDGVRRHGTHLSRSVTKWYGALMKHVTQVLTRKNS